MRRIIAIVTLALFASGQAISQELPKASILLAAQTKNIKIYTLVSPNEMFANTSHIIELPHELIVVDGQFFAPYGRQLKIFVDSL